MGLKQRIGSVKNRNVPFISRKLSIQTFCLLFCPLSSPKIVLKRSEGCRGKSVNWNFLRSRNNSAAKNCNSFQFIWMVYICLPVTRIYIKSFVFFKLAIVMKKYGEKEAFHKIDATTIAPQKPINT